VTPSQCETHKSS